MSFERTVIGRDIRYNQNITNPINPARLKIAVVHGLVDHFYKCIINFDEYDMSNVTTTVKDYIAVSNQY